MAGSLSDRQKFIKLQNHAREQDEKVRRSMLASHSCCPACCRAARAGTKHARVTGHLLCLQTLDIFNCVQRLGLLNVADLRKSLTIEKNITKIKGVLRDGKPAVKASMLANFWDGVYGMP
jgi:hypothetical protein